MISTRSAGLVIDTVVCLTLAKWETVSGRFGGYLTTSLVWNKIVEALGNDWTVAYQIPSEKWEEIIAGAFKKANYDEVTLTPRSRDHGSGLHPVWMTPA